MASYFSSVQLQEFTVAQKAIYEERSRIFSKYGINILDTDSLSSLQIYNVISLYDRDFNVNFSRNGEDASSKGVLIEQKTSKIKRERDKASFMFHALGDILHRRYIFAIRSKSDLKLMRLYDISLEENVEKVQKEMIRMKDEYMSRGFRKHDVIFLKEKFIISNLNFIGAEVFNDCVVYKDVLYS